MDPSDNEDEPQLSAGALEALQDHYREKNVRAKQFEYLKTQAESDFNDNKLSMDAFTEDWNASQFWYDDETALTFARELLRDATSKTSIAVVSAPSVFIQLKNLIASVEVSQRAEIRLLEYDERFAVFKEFVPYDFAQPLQLPVDMKGKFDRIICDPPFLSADCQTKAALTVRWLAKSWQHPESIDTASGIPAPGQQVIVCTGERMESLILKLYDKIGVRPTDFDPRHSNGLSNEFRCYANFVGDAWQWRN